LKQAKVVENCRVDKWLWATRVFKTRTQATTACKAGKVKIEEKKVKPSRMLAPGDVVTLRKDGIARTLKVLAPLEKRVGAKLVNEYMEDLTPQEEYDSARERSRTQGIGQPAGSGRPTKRKRRLLDRFFGKMEE
tara:strand:+ start:3816 stop:4217 length:402 start_codon:yes stop_codon:yes gene_type:complete